MADRVKSTPIHPRVQQALASLKSPSGLGLPPGWPEMVEAVHGLVEQAVKLLDRFAADVPEPDPSTLPAIWEPGEPTSALWRAGWPAAVTWRGMLDPNSGDSVRGLLASALEELSPERRAEVFGAFVDALASGTHSGADGAVELLVGAEALARRIGA